MSKYMLTGILAAGMFFLTSCGGSETKTTDSGTAEPASAGKSDAKAAPAPEVKIDVAGWVATDLSTASKMIPMMLNLPKDAKIEKNGNGGVDVLLNSAYTITISSQAVSNIKEAMKGDKDLTINNTTSYKNGKAIVDEPNGFVYSMQMKDEANGTKYEPEAHFFFYIEKDGAIYSVQDARPMSNGFLSGKTYTEDNAKKLYESVKASAKLK